MGIIHVPHFGKVAWSFVGALAFAACAEAADVTPVELGAGQVGVETSGTKGGLGTRAAVVGRGCGTRDMSEADRAALEARIRPLLQAQAPGLDLQGGRYDGPAVVHAVVPTYVHIVLESDGPGGEDIPDSMIEAQMQVLNDSFKGLTADGGSVTSFTFEVKGIDRTVNPAWVPIIDESPAELEMKAALRVGGPETLNLYISSVTPGLLGWATFPPNYASNPSYDGVVLLNQSLPGGTSVPYNEGDTATHEVGHWLGLFHTFEGGCAAPGDRVADTPAESSPAFGCPVGRNTCPGAGVDPIENFMDYSDDSCMDRFTVGQAKRMNAHWRTFRAPELSARPQGPLVPREPGGRGPRTGSARAAARGNENGRA
ncbi:MAG TPA: zinc metalloprotease [Polyangiaceae bacterium]|nr:zinc metalloprotease [Polyangiaceae bacterium]